MAVIIKGINPYNPYKIPELLIPNQVINTSLPTLTWQDTLYDQMFSYLYNNNIIYNNSELIMNKAKAGLKSQVEVIQAAYLQVLIEYLILFKDSVVNSDCQVTTIQNLMYQYNFPCIRNVMQCQFNMGKVFDALFNMLGYGITLDYNVLQINACVNNCSLFTLLTNVNTFLLEVGSLLNPTLQLNYGLLNITNPLLLELYRNTTLLALNSNNNTTLSYTDSLAIPLGNTVYSATSLDGNNVSCSALPLTYTGIYPYFYGTSNTSTLPTSSQIYSANKVIANSTGPINITFNNSTTPTYFWFAVPHANNYTFTSWNRGGTNSGNIGNSSYFFNSNLFMSAQNVTLTSTGLSSNYTQNYDVYMSSYATDGSIPTLLQ